MNFINALLVCSIAGLSTLIGSLVIFFHFKKENINKFITFALSFSLAIMIGISITDLIPPSFLTLINSYKISRGVLYSFVSFGVGILIIYFLQKKIDKSLNKNDLYRLGILNMIALIAHNFPEGIATFMSSYSNINLGLKLALAISFHNIPEGITIAVPIYYATNSKKQAFIKTAASAIAEPIGALIAYLFLKKYITNEIISMILILVGGLMICLAIENILPKAKAYNLNNYLLLGLILGVGLIIFNLLIL